MENVENFNNFLKSFSSTKFKDLWRAQDYILNEYTSNYEIEKDVAVELPTGAGKTLIELLIAEAWRKKTKKLPSLAPTRPLPGKWVQSVASLAFHQF